MISGTDAAAEAAWTRGYEGKNGVLYGSQNDNKLRVKSMGVEQGFSVFDPQIWICDGEAMFQIEIAESS